MKNSTLTAMILGVLTVATIVFLLVPELRPVGVIFIGWAVWGFNFVLATVLLAVLFVTPWILGFLGKGYGVRWLDNHLDKEKTIGGGQRAVLGVVSAAGVGLIWLLLVQLIVQDWNWSYGFFRGMLFWDGVWEGTPTWYPYSALYAAVTYLIVWSQTEHNRD